MKQKSPYYICDCCGKKIENLNQATLQFQQSKQLNDIHNFKIVHRFCVEENLMDLSDWDFNDNYENIVMRVLQLLSDYAPNGKEELLEILKRLTITDYEIVRPYITIAETEEVIYNNGKSRYLTAEEIQKIKSYYIQEE